MGTVRFYKLNSLDGFELLLSGLHEDTCTKKIPKLHEGQVIRCGRARGSEFLEPGGLLGIP